MEADIHRSTVLLVVIPSGQDQTIMGSDGHDLAFPGHQMSVQLLHNAVVWGIDTAFKERFPLPAFLGRVKGNTIGVKSTAQKQGCKTDQNDDHFISSE